MTGVCREKICAKRASQDLTSLSLQSNGAGTRGSDLRCTENKTEKNRGTVLAVCLSTRVLILQNVELLLPVCYNLYCLRHSGEISHNSME